jgi:hypothetical protein
LTSQSPDHAQQEPDLLLAAVMAAHFTLDEMIGDFVAQPVTGAADDLDVLGTQADLFFQFPEHRLFGGLAVLDAALRELPGVLAYALAPPHLVIGVEQDDADVRAEAFSIQHGDPQTFCGWKSLSGRLMRLRAYAAAGTPGGQEQSHRCTDVIETRSKSAKKGRISQLIL